jgi:hypothetical protein
MKRNEAGAALPKENPYGKNKNAPAFSGDVLHVGNHSGQVA